MVVLRRRGLLTASICCVLFVLGFVVVPRDMYVWSSQPANSGIQLTNWWQAAALIYWHLASPIEYQCMNMIAYGNWPLCQDPGHAVKAPCLVYSFGIANDFRFDDTMNKLGCEVHSFDPSMNVGDHKRSENTTFHAIGLSGMDSNHFQARNDFYVKTDQFWKMQTLKSIMKDLGHENRVIDVLKMDVEGHEWSVVENILDDGLISSVRQFCLEWHLFPDWPARSTYVNSYNLLPRLRNAGFLSFRKDPHPHKFYTNAVHLQGDVNYINTNVLT